MQDRDLQKIFWHSRRGMLELDLLLVPFAREAYPVLPAKDQMLYKRLLEQEDQDLFSWLLKKVSAPDPALQSITDTILAFAAGKNTQS